MTSPAKRTEYSPPLQAEKGEPQSQLPKPVKPGRVILLFIVGVFILCISLNVFALGVAYATYSAKAVNSNTFSTTSIQPPTNLRGSNVLSLVTISWTASPSGTQYNVYILNNITSSSCPTSIGSYNILGGMPITGVSYSETRLFGLLNYYCYMVQTVSGSWTSLSNPVVAVQGILNLGLAQSQTTPQKSKDATPASEPAVTPTVLITPEQTPGITTTPIDTLSPEPSITPAVTRPKERPTLPPDATAIPHPGTAKSTTDTTPTSGIEATVMPEPTVTLPTATTEPTAPNPSPPPTREISPTQTVVPTPTVVVAPVPTATPVVTATPTAVVAPMPTATAIATKATVR